MTVALHLVAGEYSTLLLLSAMWISAVSLGAQSGSFLRTSGTIGSAAASSLTLPTGKGVRFVCITPNGHFRRKQHLWAETLQNLDS